MYSVFLLMVFCQSSYGSLSPTVVVTSVGAIAGLRKTTNIAGQRKVITEFLGIPYGEDTSGNNRFRKPIPKAHFSLTFNAFTLSPPCMQFPNLLSNCTTGMTEDCLMLNIYVPQDLGTNTSSGLLPVMIWIHGGAFESGAAREYNGEALSSVGDVIVVTVNYRLAEFGFLNIGDSRASGNQGLWDQRLAIKWVKDNIQAFRGNPEEITIFGESAGAVSVTLQSLYAGNKGLFKRVIAESGSALSYWSINSNPNASALFVLFGCEKGPVDQVECLRKLSTHDIYKILSQPNATIGCCRIPSIDHDFIVEEPMDIAFSSHSVSFEARQFFQSLDILTGVNNGEGAMYVSTIWRYILNETNIDNLTTTVSDFETKIVPRILSIVMSPPRGESTDVVNKALVFEYVDWDDPKDNNRMRNRLIKLSNDISFFVSTAQLLKAHSQSIDGHSYLYEFTAEPPVRLLETPKWFHGANHVDELEYVFGGPFQNLDTFKVLTSRNGTVMEKDKTLALGIMTAWTNFAKTRLVLWEMHTLL